ncbi:MAG: hypothetical protein ACLQO1_07735 [Steroidobacteraceae bacterium]
MKKKPTTTLLASQRLTVAERRAFIWANPRIHSKGAPGPYYICTRTPTKAEPMTDEDMTVEKFGVKEAFDYLYRHANIERTAHGYWAVGQRADDTRMVLEDIEEAALYSEVLRDLYLAVDASVRIDCDADLTAEPQREPKPLPPPRVS